MSGFHQTLRGWSVGTGRRLIGQAHNRPGHADGATVMTSPVLQVRLMGPSRTPVAFTESGSAYWLAEPASGFGLDKAEAFVWEMSRAEIAADPVKPDPMLATMVLRIATPA